MLDDDWWYLTRCFNLQGSLARKGFICPKWIHRESLSAFTFQFAFVLTYHIWAAFFFLEMNGLYEENGGNWKKRAQYIAQYPENSHGFCCVYPGVYTHFCVSNWWVNWKQPCSKTLGLVGLPGSSSCQKSSRCLSWHRLGSLGHGRQIAWRLAKDFEARWWFQIFFLCSPRSLGRWSNLTSIFFRWGWFNHQLSEDFSNYLGEMKSPKHRGKWFINGTFKKNSEAILPLYCKDFERSVCPNII